MRIGAILTLAGVREPDQIAEQARDLEAAGFDGIWSPHAMGRGFMMVDPFIALTVAAAATRHVELGTAILQLPLYNPTDVALKALSLQLVSGGRFRLGLGVGSTPSDFLVHRANFEDRFKAFDASLGLLKETLADGRAGGGNIAPPDNLAGGPPLLFGTWGRNVARAAEEFDGWIASGMHRTPAECIDALSGYRAAGGRRAVVSTILISAETDLGQMGDTLAQYEDGGFDDAVVMIMPGGPSIDDVRKLVR